MDTNNPIIDLAQKPKMSVNYIDPHGIDPKFAIELLDTYRIEVTYDSKGFCHLDNFSEGMLLSAIGNGIMSALRNWAVQYNNLYKESAE